MSDIRLRSHNSLEFQEAAYRCAIGRSGVAKDKHEGDGATPSGCFPIRRVLYRADRTARPQSVFRTDPIHPNDAWSDDVSDAAYNTAVSLPYSPSHERLWREDNIYDIIVVLGYNDAPPIPGKGSCIFMHIARENYSPTAGCIALSENDLRSLLAACDGETDVCTSTAP